MNRRPRQQNTKFRPSIYGAGDENVPTPQIQIFFYNAQSQGGTGNASRIGCPEESFEQILQFLFGYTYPSSLTIMANLPGSQRRLTRIRARSGEYMMALESKL